MRRLVLLLAASAVASEDLPTPGEQVQAELSAALAAGDAARALPLVAEAGEICLHAYSPAEADALLALIGTASRSPDQAIAVAALHALGRTGAPAAAAHVEPFLRAVRKGQEKLVVAAMEAADRLAAPNLLPNLLDIARDCPDFVVAEQALLALGGYARAEPPVRERAFREALQVAQTLSKRPQRWQRLQWPALRSLQRVSGKRLNSVEQFTDWWRHARTRKDPFD
jgi:hypothetical protein